jgi:hypothetical protein
MTKLLTTVAILATLTTAAAAKGEVPRALQGITWCNENDACIVFSPLGLTFDTSLADKQAGMPPSENVVCSILRITEKPARTYEIQYECGKVHVEQFILQAPDRLVLRYWNKQPVGRWDYLLYTPKQ